MIGVRIPKETKRQGSVDEITQPQEAPKGGEKLSTEVQNMTNKVQCLQIQDQVSIHDVSDIEEVYYDASSDLERDQGESTDEGDQTPDEPLKLRLRDGTDVLIDYVPPRQTPRKKKT